VLAPFTASQVIYYFGFSAGFSLLVVLVTEELDGSAVAPSLPAVAALWLANGVPAGLQRPVARSMQQRLTPNHLLGRVNVTTRIFTRGIIVFGALAAGALASLTDVRWSFAVGGAIQVVGAVVMWRVLARLQE
jgi:hypothetical protein